MTSMVLVLLLQQGFWGVIPEIPEARQEVGVAAVEGKIFVIGGLAPGGSGSTSVQVFDTRRGIWSAATPLPAAIHHPMVSAVGSRIYVAGGYGDEGPLQTLYEYDVDSDVWVRRSDMPGRRGAGAAATLGGRLYVFGGERDGDTVRDAAAYSPADDSWVMLPPMPTPRNHLGAAVSRGRIYVIGGRPGNQATNEMFDPATNQWAVMPPMPTGRSGLAAAGLGRFVYVFGGEGNRSSPVGTFPHNEVYDAALDSWIPAASMPVPRHGIGAAVIGNRIYVPSGGPIEGVGTTAHSDFFEVSQEILLPQFVVGGGYQTEITIVNPAARPAEIRVSLTDSDGKPLTAEVEGLAQSTVSLTVPPLAARSIRARDSSGNPRIGVVRLQANVRVGAAATIHFAGQPPVAVYPSSLEREGVFPARYFPDIGQNTGVSIANTGADTATVTAILVETSGAERARIVRTLQAGQQQSRLLTEMFDLGGSTAFDGTVIVHYSRPLATAAFLLSREGFVTLPVIPVE